MRTLYFVSLIVAVSAFGSAASRSLPRARAAGAHTRVGQGPVDLRQGVRGQQPPARTAEANKPFDPIAAPWPQLTAAEHEAVQQLIDQGKWSEALAELVTILKKRGVTFDTVRGGLPVYDPDLPTQEEGRTSVESMAAGFVLLPRMQIGRAAFQNHATGVYTSIPTSGSHFLYATVMHELVHAWQFYSEGICEHVWHGSKAAEVEAYTTELKNRARAGISPAEIALLRGRLAEYGGPPLPRVVKERRHAADAGPGPYVAAPSRITSAKLRQQPTLRFTIALPKSQFNAGEPVPLSMLVANVSAQTLEVNRRLEINGQQEPRPFREVYLRITMPSGQVALFRWLVTIGVPGRQDVATLAPGQSVGRTQDIADLYTLGQAGTYGVLATYENIMPVHGRWVVTDSVASNRLTFRIGAGPAGSAPAAAAVRYHAAMVPAGGALSAAATPLHAAPSGSAAARPQGAAAAAAPACPAPLPPGAPTPPTPAAPQAGVYVLTANAVTNPNAPELTINATGGTAIWDHPRDGGTWKVEYIFKVPRTLTPGKSFAITLSIKVDHQEPSNPNSYGMNARAPDFAQSLNITAPATMQGAKTFTVPFSASYRTATGIKDVYIVIGIVSAEVTFTYHRS